MGLSDAVCARLAALPPEEIPASTMLAAKRALLDATGVIFAASGLAEEARPFASLAQSAGPGSCAILGTGARVAPAMAALANGAMAHALDYEDALDLKPGHPNASLVPALIALAQANGPITGPTFLTALAIGCDVSCRLGLALGQDMEVGGWYPPPILAGLGATLGAAKLLGLDATQMRDALSLALCQIVMPGEIKHSQRTVIRAVREAFPAQAAVQSALLAREGVAGFEQPLEGRDGFYALYAGGQFDPSVLLNELGERFWIEQLTFKPWPSCRGTHPFIEMALDLLHDHQLAPADIARIAVHVDDVQYMLVEPIDRKCAPETLIDAKFSIPFSVALALARSTVDLDSFSRHALADPEVLALAGKVTVCKVGAPPWQRGSGGKLELLLHDGRSFVAQVENALGCPARPLSRAVLVAKFVDCLARAEVPKGKAQAAKLAEQIMTLEDCADVGGLFA